MEALVSLWNSLDTGMKCVLAFMIWLIIIMMANNSAAKSRGPRRRPPF